MDWPALKRNLRRWSGRATVEDANWPWLMPEDVILESYPRSGNTWLRILLVDVISQFHGHETSTRLPFFDYRVIPDCHATDIREVEPELTDQLKIIKSHSWNIVGPRRVVYVFRDACDSLCSYHNFAGQNFRKPPGELEPFCLKRISEWVRHMETALALRERDPSRICFASFESLHSQPAETLASVCGFLELEVTRAQISTAIENHSFEKQKAAQERASEEGVKFKYILRQGKVNTSKRELTEETYARISAISKPLFERAETYLNEDLLAVRSS